MIIMRIAISVPGNADNAIEVMIQERADTNDAESAMAISMHAAIRKAVEGLHDRLPAGEVTVTEREG